MNSVVFLQTLCLKLLPWGFFCLISLCLYVLVSILVFVYTGVSFLLLWFACLHVCFKRERKVMELGVWGCGGELGGVGGGEKHDQTILYEFLK